MSIRLDRILITGASGFLGRHTLRILRDRYGPERVVAVSSRDYDLMNAGHVERMFADIAPTVVVHYAGYSGGIGANRAFPADFYFRNTVMTALVFEAAAKYRVSKLIYPMGGCSYPAGAISPIDESQLWAGYPQAESAAYSTAKMMGTVAARAYEAQYGLNSTVIIPGNMYGEWDNFRLSDSHVVAALIRRCHEATLADLPDVTMWGSGRPTRDFVYAGDVAATIPFFIENFDEVGPINLSTGTRTSIRALAGTIARLTGFNGAINWDLSKPDGQLDKIFATDKLRALGLSCPTTLDQGLTATIEWFKRHYHVGGDGLRL